MFNFPRFSNLLTPEQQQNPDRIVAGRGVGGELRFNDDGLIVGGGEASGAKITWEELLYLKEKTGAVTIGGGVGRGAELPGVKARMEEEKAREKAQRNKE